jgi:DNA-binding NtrC family response regulator
MTGGTSSLASGTARLQLIALEASGLTIFPLPDAGAVEIGRGERCDVRIRDALVSRRHAVLRLNPLSIEDTGSANGTSLGSERLVPGIAAEVRAGQTISIGRTILLLRHADPESTAENDRESGAVPSNPSLVVIDPAMKNIYAMAERLAQGRINVLILGETGVGKEVIAEAIHRASPRRDASLVRINCATLTEALLESELFGHERGSFTGACTAKAGLIELAHRGTVFLDEVGELSPTLQAKLLRVLETQETLRIGALRARRVDVRFLFATNRDLRADVEAGRFRSDLFFRLKGAIVQVPPLRERPSEVLPLAETCITRAAQQLGLPRPRLTDEARQRLLSHSWPGNVRELRNAMERAVLLCRSALIRPEDLAMDGTSDSPMNGARQDGFGASSTPGAEGKELDAERERIAQALVECGGNQSRAAELLGIPRRTFVRRIAELGLPRPRRPR